MDKSQYDQLWRDWWPYCERWAARLDRVYPRSDFGTVANVAFWKALERYDPARGRFPSFLRVNLRNTWTTARRAVQRRGRVEVLGNMEKLQWRDERSDSEDGFSALDALECLPWKHREAIESVVLRDQSYGTAAAELGVDASTVHYRVQAGLERMRRSLSA